jgi:hypothetical protein
MNKLKESENRNMIIENGAVTPPSSFDSNDSNDSMSSIDDSESITDHGNFRVIRVYCRALKRTRFVSQVISRPAKRSKSTVTKSRLVLCVFALSFFLFNPFNLFVNPSQATYDSFNGNQQMSGRTLNSIDEASSKGEY